MSVFIKASCYLHVRSHTCKLSIEINNHIPHEGSVCVFLGGVLRYGPLLANEGGGGGWSESSLGVLLDKLLLIYNDDCSLGIPLWGGIPRRGEMLAGGGGPLAGDIPGPHAGDVPGNAMLSGGLCIP